MYFLAQLTHDSANQVINLRVVFGSNTPIIQSETVDSGSKISLGMSLFIAPTQDKLFLCVI